MSEIMTRSPEITAGGKDVDLSGMSLAEIKKLLEGREITVDLTMWFIPGSEGLEKITEAGYPAEFRDGGPSHMWVTRIGGVVGSVVGSAPEGIEQADGGTWLKLTGARAVWTGEDGRLTTSDPSANGEAGAPSPDQVVWFNVDNIYAGQQVWVSEKPNNPTI